MKKALGLIMTGFLFACSSPAESEDVKDPIAEEISTETQDEVKKATDANVELEKLDGELDSLMNTLE